jgi:hypothetical protein
MAAAGAAVARGRFRAMSCRRVPVGRPAAHRAARACPRRVSRCSPAPAAGPSRPGGGGAGGGPGAGGGVGGKGAAPDEGAEPVPSPVPCGARTGSRLRPCREAGGTPPGRGELEGRQEMEDRKFSFLPFQVLKPLGLPARRLASLTSRQGHTSCLGTLPLMYPARPTVASAPPLLRSRPRSPSRRGGCGPSRTCCLRCCFPQALFAAEAEETVKDVILFIRRGCAPGRGRYQYRLRPVRSQPPCRSLMPPSLLDSNVKRIRSGSILCSRLL